MVTIPGKSTKQNIQGTKQTKKQNKSKKASIHHANQSFKFNKLFWIGCVLDLNFCCSIVRNSPKTQQFNFSQFKPQTEIKTFTKTHNSSTKSDAKHFICKSTFTESFWHKIPITINKQFLSPLPPLHFVCMYVCLWVCGGEGGCCC